MNKSEAKKLAETVTNEQLKQMMLNAQAGIKNWEEQARVNKGLTKGAAFNIFSCAIREGREVTHNLAKRNMIWEFGEFLTGYQKPVKEKRSVITPRHQEPIFLQ